MLRQHPKSPMSSNPSVPTRPVRKGRDTLRSLVPRSERDISQKQWERRVIAEAHSDARIDFSEPSGAGGGRDVNLYVGEQPRPGDQQRAEARPGDARLSEVRDPRINADMSRPEILIRPRLDLAAQLGVTVEISQTVLIATLGDLAERGEIFAFRPADPNSCQLDRERAARPLGHREPAGADQLRPVGPGLKAVADISFGEGPTRIRRFNQNRRAWIEADLNGVELGTAMDKIHALPTAKNPPQGATGRRYRRRGSDGRAVREFRHRDVHRHIDGLRSAGAAVRPRVPAVIILPWLCPSPSAAPWRDSPFQTIRSRSPRSGFLMLMGIVAKNSILLVDFAIEEMRAGGIV